MPTWRDRLRSVWTRVAPGRGGDGAYQRLRTAALGLDSASTRLPDGARWSGAAVAAMEVGLAGSEGKVMIVAVADGTVSRYTSSGGGAIGLGDHAAVRGTGDRFRAVVADSHGLLQRTQSFPAPKEGEVRFHARVGDDRLTAAAPEAALRTGRHQLAPLYAAGQDVLTEIRLASEPEQ